ncbi:MAG: class I SAM-dependent methyltransferase [Synechococcales cyanobacterium RM1_1_8]|nr:class I SAM-dependent methyltransferase [Synechococcales cyanobacterium RM1_1_8]
MAQTALSQAYQQKQSLFDRWAAFYDWSFPSVFYQAVHRRLLESIELPEQPNVLDLGCGTGKLFQRLLPLAPDLTGLGLDLSPEMVAQARRANSCPAQVQYQVGNATAIPAPDHCFDLVFNSISFLHYPQPAAVLAEIQRVLKPGGCYHLADFAPRWAEQPQVLAQSVSPIQFHSPAVRERLGQSAGRLALLGHQWLLGPVLLTSWSRAELSAKSANDPDLFR